MKLQVAKFDLHSVMTRLTGEMQRLYQLHKFDYLYRGELWVSADKNRIVRVLINYMTNAVKFSYPASPIKISSAIKGRFAEIYITDNGIGVPKGWEYAWIIRVL